MAPPSTTDIVTNIVRLAPLTLDKHLLGIIRGELSDDYISTFLHEGLHHWCFLTPVGQAICLQRLRARSSLLSDPPDLAAAEDALLRVEAVESALRPVIEGLAVLAELHSTIDPTRYDHQSRLLMWLLAIACRHVPDPQKPDYFSTAFLRQAYAPAGIARREAILSGPFQTSLGGYLPGYMAMRAKWREAAAHSGDFHTIGTFLAAVRFSVFYDPFILEMLLESPFDDPMELVFKTSLTIAVDMHPKALDRADWRRQLLFEEGEVYGYHDLMSADKIDEGDEQHPPRSLAYGDPLADQIRILGRLASDIFHSKTEGEIQGNPFLLRARDLFWLASERRPITREGDALLIRCRGQWLQIGRIRPGDDDYPSPTGTFDGWVSVVFGLIDTWLAVFTGIGEDVLSATAIMGSHYGGAALTIQDMNRIDAGERQLEAKVRERIPAALDERRARLRRAAFADIDDWCAEVALGDSNVAERREMVKGLELDGWLGALGGDQQLLRTLALLLTNATAGPFRREPRPLLESYGQSVTHLERLESQLKRLRSSYLIEAEHA
jgi:hypothetical protein